jgi:hypothetical protein
MLFSGSFRVAPSASPQPLISRLVVALESMRCEVSRERDSLSVTLPGLDGLLLPRLFLVSGFHDRLELKIHPEGRVDYRIPYWSGAQRALHLAITATFALELLLSRGEGVTKLVTGLLAANLFVALSSLTPLHRVRLRAARLLQGSAQSSA